MKNKKIAIPCLIQYRCSTNHLKRMILSLLITFSVLFLILHPDTSYSLQFSNLEVKPEVTLSGEYDDNINLANKDTEEVKDDIILHLIPSIGLLLPYKDHRFSVDINGDHRRGTDNHISDTNMSIEGLMDYNFSGGLKLKLNDTYISSRFDQALFEEAGVSKSNSNTYGIASSYIFIERVKAEGEYSHKLEEFEGVTLSSERKIDTFEGKLSVPVTQSVMSHVSYYFQEQDFDKLETSSYEKNRFMAGIGWKGPYRFSLLIEGGHESIDYSLHSVKDYSNPVINIGLKVIITEATQGSFSFGWNGYGKSVYDAGLKHQFSEDTYLMLSGSKHTDTSITSTSSSNTYDSSVINLQFVEKFVDKITMTLLGSHQVQQSSTGSEDEIWISKVSFDYPIQAWLKVGTYYQYAMREATNKESEYKNNRLGMFATLVF